MSNHKLEEKKNKEGNSPDLAVFSSNITWSRILNYLQIIKQQVLSTRFIKNKICITTTAI